MNAASDRAQPAHEALGAPPWSCAHLAAVFQGTLHNAPAPEDRTIHRLAPLHEDAPDALGFARSGKNIADLERSNLAAAFVSNELVADYGSRLASMSVPLIQVDNPDLAMNAALAAVHGTRTQDTVPPGVHPTAIIDDSAVVHETVSIGSGVTIGPGAQISEHARLDVGAYVGADVQIGAHTYLGPSAKVLARCVIGSHCALHSGVVIGTDGFGYIPAPGGAGILKVPHVGRVVIGHYVEIGANSCVDRGKLGDTTIGDQSKIDNLVQIGHNCTIGRAVIICGQAAIAGSCTICDGVTLGGAVMIADNLTIGAGAKLGGGSGLMNHIPPMEQWAGMPAQPSREYFRGLAAVRQLPTLLKDAKQFLGPNSRSMP